MLMQELKREHEEEEEELKRDLHHGLFLLLQSIAGYPAQTERFY